MIKEEDMILTKADPFLQERYMSLNTDQLIKELDKLNHEMVISRKLGKDCKEILHIMKVVEIYLNRSFDGGVSLGHVVN